MIDLEWEFKELYDVNYAIGVNSGTSALLTALASIGVKEGDEVILPSFTFSAPAYAIEQLGAICKFADIDANTWNITAENIEPLITDKTAAIIVVHLYGLPADMFEILRLADSYNIPLIEDCAEAFLSKIDGVLAGTFGDMAIFSFEKSKHISAGGGGMIITNNGRFARNAKSFSTLGYRPHVTKEELQNPDADRHYVMGYNFKLPEPCAEIALSKIRRAKEFVDFRIRNAMLYDEALPAKYQRQYVPSGFTHTYWTYSFLLQFRSQYEKFRTEYINLGGHKFYAGWKCTPDEPFFRKKYKVSIPVARDIQRRLVCLNTGLDIETTKVQADILKGVLQ